MGGLNLDKLLFDPADLTDSANVGAYLRAGSDGDLITSTLISGKEALDVNIVGGADSGVFAEDSAHSSAANGQFILAVRNDTQGSLVDTNGDYAPIQVDAQGRIRVVTDLDLSGDLVGDDEVDTEDPLKVGGHAYAGPLAAVAAGDKVNLGMDLYRRVYTHDAPNIGVACVEVTVGATEVALPATALAGRTRMIVQNVSNNDVFVGPTGLATTDGLRIVKGGSLSLEIGEAVALFAIAAGAGNAVRVFELA